MTTPWAMAWMLSSPECEWGASVCFGCVPLGVCLWFLLYEYWVFCGVNSVHHCRGLKYGILGQLLLRDRHWCLCSSFNHLSSLSRICTYIQKTDLSTWNVDEQLSPGIWPCVWTVAGLSYVLYVYVLKGIPSKPALTRCFIICES